MRWLILFILLLPLVAAQRGHLTLLTVAETQDELQDGQGGTADLYLEIRPGSGQIFLDTFPLTRLDTQSSTRFANQVACAYADADCGNSDFFYTIRAESSVVGGPSAGAAIAVLTAMLLADERVDESIAITGTINSGGIIGPVAGIRQKAEAAHDAGLDLVLISAFSNPTEVNRSYLAGFNESGNGSLNYSTLYDPLNISALNIDVQEVATLEEAIAYYRGSVPPLFTPVEATPPAVYVETMQEVADRLCTRRESLFRSLGMQGLLEETEANFTSRKAEAVARADWYSVASYCFASLIRLRSEAFEELSQYERRAQLSSLLGQINRFERNLAQRNLTTLAELETSMIVEERLSEALDALREENLTNISASGLAFAYERYNSANVWSAFFSMESPAITLDQDHLARACNEKLIEAEERINYAELYLPASALLDAREELAAAQGRADVASYQNCLFRAAKAQALADLLGGSFAVPRDKVDALVQRKLSAVAQVIERQEAYGYFPIIGFSYHQYASSLAAHDPYSSLTFTEYSLQLSDLQRFFPRQRGFRLTGDRLYLALLFGSGLLLGVALGFGGGLAAAKRRKPRENPSRKAKGFPGKKR